MKLFVPNSAHLGNIESFLRHIDSTGDDTLEISFHPRWVSVHPVVLAMVACIGKAARDRGIDVQVEVPQVASLRYMVRMGLFDFLGVDPEMPVTEHEAAGRFIPLTQIRTNQELQQFNIDMIPLLHSSPEDAEAIRYVFSEMVRNVLEHASSPVGAIACAQYFSKTNRLAIGVADAGRGIHHSMLTFHNPTSEREAIRQALRPGVTGATSARGGNEYNGGAGLFFTKSMAATSRNFFLLISGDAMFKLRRTPEAEEVVLHPDPASDRATWAEGLTSWPGAVVGIDIALESGASFNTLLGEIRKAYRLDVDGRRRAIKKARFS